MERKFIRKKITYTGSALRSHYIYKEFGLLGDSVVAFEGPAQVEGEMVDLVDRKAKAYIQSPHMVHFLIEHFGLPLSEGIWQLRSFISLIQESINHGAGRFVVRRSGNDLYAGKRKLSVAIATASTVSTLIHVGVNVKTKGTPVPTVGLSELRIQPRRFAEAIMKNYAEEVTRVQQETAKVRAVGEA